MVIHEFQSFGYDSVYFDSFPHPDNPSSIQRNVVAVKDKERFVDSSSFFNIKIQPNSQVFIITLSLDKRGPVYLSLYDILGRLKDKLCLSEVEAGFYRIPWRIKGLKKGVYFFIMEIGKNVYKKKLLSLII